MREAIPRFASMLTSQNGGDGRNDESGDVNDNKAYDSDDEGGQMGEADNDKAIMEENDGSGDPPLPPLPADNIDFYSS